MDEIEVKIIDIDKNEMTRKVEALGAKKIFEGEVNSIFFEYPDSMLELSKKTLRLRKKGEQAYLTLKTGKSKEYAKICDEIETEVEDFEKMRLILEGLGFIAKKAMFKHRTSYRLGNVLFEFDDYEGIPSFMEIEAPTIDEIRKFAEILNVPENKIKNWGGKEIFAHYGKNF